MRRAAPVSLALLLVLAVAPTTVRSSPLGGETNPLGTLRWLPRNANEAPPASQFRLVVAYDSSLNANGSTRPLLAKGPFRVKITTPSPDVRMINNSASVQDLAEATGQNGLDAVDQVAIALAGDARDGDCSKLGTPAFSAAYSTTRSFFVPGTTPYQPVSSPGACEKLDSSVEIRDASGVLLGFNTTVTTHVPGFWIDVTWPTRTLPVLGGTGRLLAEVWYDAAYDSNADGSLDGNGASKSVGSPGDYNLTFSFSAIPGGMGPSCTAWGVPDQPGTWQDVRVQVPEGATRVTFKLFPKGDWDLIVIDPVGTKAISGNWTTMDETEIVPSAGAQNIPQLVPGEFIMRACNFSGEQVTFGSVIIE